MFAVLGLYCIVLEFSLPSMDTNWLLEYMKHCNLHNDHKVGSSFSYIYSPTLPPLAYLQDITAKLYETESCGWPVE